MQQKSVDIQPNTNVENELLYKVDCTPDKFYIFFKNILIFGAVLWCFSKSLDLLLIHNSYSMALIFILIVVSGLYAILVDIRNCIYGGLEIYKDEFRTFSGKHIPIEHISFQLEALMHGEVLTLNFYEKVNEKSTRILQCKHKDLGEDNLLSLIQVLSNISGREQKDFSFEDGVAQTLYIHPLIKN